MGKYFGTDGVRGRANEGLTLDMAIQIGQYLGMYYGKEKHARILIGKDTRLSGDMFELGLAAGATSMGAQVYLLGVCPTPAVSYLIQKERFDCGIMAVSYTHLDVYKRQWKIFLMRSGVLSVMRKWLYKDWKQNDILPEKMPKRA